MFLVLGSCCERRRSLGASPTMLPLPIQALGLALPPADDGGAAGCRVGPWVLLGPHLPRSPLPLQLFGDQGLLNSLQGKRSPALGLEAPSASKGGEGSRLLGCHAGPGIGCFSARLSQHPKTQPQHPETQSQHPEAQPQRCGCQPPCCDSSASPGRWSARVRGFLSPSGQASRGRWDLSPHPSVLTRFTSLGSPLWPGSCCPPLLSCLSPASLPPSVCGGGDHGGPPEGFGEPRSPVPFPCLPPFSEWEAPLLPRVSTWHPGPRTRGLAPERAG